MGQCWGVISCLVGFFFFFSTQVVCLPVTIWCMLTSLLWQFRRDNSDLKDGTCTRWKIWVNVVYILHLTVQLIGGLATVFVLQSKGSCEWMKQILLFFVIREGHMQNDLLQIWKREPWGSFTNAVRLGFSTTITVLVWDSTIIRVSSPKLHLPWHPFKMANPAMCGSKVILYHGTCLANSKTRSCFRRGKTPGFFSE